MFDALIAELGSKFGLGAKSSALTNCGGDPLEDK